MKYLRRVDGRQNGGCVRQRLYPAKSGNSSHKNARREAAARGAQ
jgi:hypothetical protein